MQLKLNKKINFTKQSRKKKKFKTEFGKIKNCSYMTLDNF